MSRRDLPKLPTTGKYNVPRPGERRMGNDRYIILKTFSSIKSIEWPLKENSVD